MSMDLRLAWWNTALSPTKNPNRASADELEIAATVVRALTEEGVDILALCEVADEDLDYMVEQGVADGYGLVRAMTKAGRGSFDVCLLYRLDTVSVVAQTNLVVTINNASIRLGQHFVMAVEGDPSPLHLITSHWPSVATLAQHHPDRFRLGDRLRMKVDEVLEADDSAHIVLMGDYNDEPFDYSISANLQASRDSGFVNQRPGLLYNPFWRHLSSFDHGIPNQLTDKGTYFHRGATLHRWRTYDHMMFSSALIKGTAGWRLDEHATRVVDFPLYTELVAARTHVFDHLPIIGRIHRSTNP